jgi:two-component system, chemotaxis family, chemotaxis protein CheY
MQKQVLIVDDCAITRRLVALYLRGAGFSSIQAEDGLEALEKLAQDSVDVVITDLNMPRMDGLALTKSLRSEDRYARLPIVMLTTEGQELERMKGHEAGVSEYLTKPVTQEHLGAVVKKLTA